MASFEDYDEFGNYIGADLDSDDEEEQQNQFLQQQPQVAPLEGFDDEPMPGPGADEGALMEVDGSYLTTTLAFLSRLVDLPVLLL
jgi:116 kDa U5 small nuclear ribonucleoprotein component